MESRSFHQLGKVQRRAFSYLSTQTPPHVIRLCIGNMRRRDLWIFLEQVWPAVLEASAQPGIRLTRVLRTHLETT